jgi:NADH dehydrogenase
MGVHIHLNKRVTDYDGQLITCEDGLQLNASLVIWAAGVKAVIPTGIPVESIKFGRISVDEYNIVAGLQNVYAVGDVATMITEENPRGHVMVAQPAMQQGALLAKNLVHKRSGKELKKFKYKDLGSMATIGRNKAVAEFPFAKMAGWFAWMAWLLVHVFQLIGFRNRISVMINWAQNYFRHARDLRLIIRPYKREVKE